MILILFSVRVHYFLKLFDHGLVFAFFFLFFFGRHTCPRCGLTLGTVSLLTRHQLLLCDQRTPAESRHGRCVIEVAKVRYGLAVLRIFSSQICCMYFFSYDDKMNETI